MLGDAIEIRTVLEPLVERLGYELVYVTISGSKSTVLRTFIDAPGGITLGDCELVSHRISDLLDIEDLLQGEYALEVSSPGLARPLVKPEHFLRYEGYEVSIKAKTSHDGRKNFQGVLKKAGSNTAIVEVDGSMYELSYSDMRKANLVSESVLEGGSRSAVS
ncbi:MAG: ribosome maturation factor RimP [Acidiferrobacteraceae bacterium]|nr:ribosome maturation factor RimP [Acidiferrobacteraceae bacterium]|tara:strand:- start:1696 stop:2181 length:486 start_codon:yes stop_codon:yes gene_type:complete